MQDPEITLQAHFLPPQKTILSVTSCSFSMRILSLSTSRLSGLVKSV
jgi:hypothetical protein